MSIELVYDRIYISDGKSAESGALIRGRGINRIITVALEYDPQHSGVTVYRCGLHDEHPGKDRNTDDQLRAAVDALVHCYGSGCITLVNCQAGHNRSAAVVVGALAAARRFPNVYEAYGRIAAMKALRIQPLLLQHLAELYPGTAT